MKGLSVIIPVKFPEPYVSSLCWNLEQILHYLDHEVLIQTEPGLTNAVVEGVKLASYDTIVVMDSDGSHNPNTVLKMYNLMQKSRKYNLMSKYDLIVGTKEKDETSWSRQFISKVYRWFAKKLLDIKIRDPMSGFVLGTKTIFESLKPSSDYKFLLQLLMHNPKPIVFEWPIHFHKRKAGHSKASVITGFKTLHSIIVLWWNQ